MDKSKSFQENYISNEEYIVNTYGILNAYYFPSETQKQALYKNITPVNSFRILLNNYFDTNYELLEDTNYFGYYGHVSDMPDVSEKVKKYYK